jgi:hypothetical protein
MTPREQFIHAYVEAYIAEWSAVSRQMLPIGEIYVDHPRSVTRMLARANAAAMWEVLLNEPHPRPHP